MNKVDDFFFAVNAVSGEYLPMRHAETDTPNRLMASAICSTTTMPTMATLVPAILCFKTGDSPLIFPYS